MELTQDLLSGAYKVKHFGILLLNKTQGLVKEICGSYVVEYHPHGRDNPPVVIDFTPPFKVSIKPVGKNEVFFNYCTENSHVARP